MTSNYEELNSLRSLSVCVSKCTTFFVCRHASRPVSHKEARTRRRKCKIIPGHLRCQICETQNLVCSRAGTLAGASYRSPGEARQQIQHQTVVVPAHENATSASVGIWDKSVCVELVDLYFTYIHDQFHSMFHRPSFMLDLQQNKAPNVIVYAMMATAARFSDNAMFAGIPPPNRAEPYARESQALLNLRDISVSTIHACVLLGTVSISDGEAAAESVFYSAACRIANCLDLPTLSSPSPITRDIYLRVYWTLCMIDVWSSDGMNLPRQMTRRGNVPLPLDEETFLNLSPEGTSDLDLPINPDRNNSLLAQMIKLNSILLEVNDYIKDLTTAPLALGSEDRVADLSLKLDNWLITLPDYMRDTPENLRAYAAKGLGRFFVAIYLGYYHFGQLLFYQYLDEQQSGLLPTSSAVECGAQKCKEHAMYLSRIIDAAMSTPGCDVKYSMVGHITVVASSVHIHTLLFETDEKEIRQARGQLERNFDHLVTLRKYWSTLEVCFSRLKTFHELCRRSMHTSYRMDRWMLRFLTEFARPIDAEERQDGENSDLDFKVWMGENIERDVTSWETANNSHSMYS
ncbi:hypothetical protein QQS21_004455 [Conoideocrella luteorostrata]|uniref:Xylanolytic transcriptional activator regulatory domain-containing protein n=1 Tax=Conoideocrella luteorostrata TaxID=1105319 RepID=A0AAJ0CRD8_9HYPO|nr:hypothetical protein QQS21_004455 [Conoideocrella luteorostrata]